ncbi:MAG: GAF domain-containing protein, partial [Proteobacteria bacterium]|nr:GAF domain-containing protein [Pseudomonadota bacterium]
MIELSKDWTVFRVKIEKGLSFLDEGAERSVDMSLGHLASDLQSILNSFLDLIECDGGSIYTLEKNLQGEPVLVFKAMVTRSLGITTVPELLKSTVFRLDETSLVGKSGLNRKVYKENYHPLALAADGTGGSAPRNPIDETIGYHTENILSAPLLTPRGDLVGVIQLVNKNSDDEWGGFSERDERLCGIVSAQASLAIENSTLLVEQERILDG